ncbi:hypothetical protein HELRODRAFT_178909 [Helobdella robusta]|uniref:PH domain-containing protein n=1 Tax=Helobdella robusta TaxID=6412 RepID=T1FDV9_HELRO|nr:hypothetical protein HELRODRAFT_178909 [Helobdella robusta]ESN95987.1 hypothetical protein HELRODRAFT_178909 [Helobdella robusta]
MNVSIEVLRRRGVDYLANLVRELEQEKVNSNCEYTKSLNDLNTKLQNGVVEIQNLRQRNKDLNVENEDLKNVCLYLDDERLKLAKLLEEWNNFGKYIFQHFEDKTNSCKIDIDRLEANHKEIILENSHLKQLLSLNSSGKIEQTAIKFDQIRKRGDGSSSPSSTSLEIGRTNNHSSNSYTNFSAINTPPSSDISSISEDTKYVQDKVKSFTSTKKNASINKVNFPNSCSDVRKDFNDLQIGKNHSLPQIANNNNSHNINNNNINYKIGNSNRNSNNNVSAKIRCYSVSSLNRKNVNDNKNEVISSFQPTPSSSSSLLTSSSLSKLNYQYDNVPLVVPPLPLQASSSGPLFIGHDIKSRNLFSLPSPSSSSSQPSSYHHYNLQHASSTSATTTASSSMTKPYYQQMKMSSSSLPSTLYNSQHQQQIKSGLPMTYYYDEASQKQFHHQQHQQQNLQQQPLQQQLENSTYLQSHGTQQRQQQNFTPAQHKLQQIIMQSDVNSINKNISKNININKNINPPYNNIIGYQAVQSNRIYDSTVQKMPNQTYMVIKLLSFLAVIKLVLKIESSTSQKMQSNYSANSGSNSNRLNNNTIAEDDDDNDNVVSSDREKIRQACNQWQRRFFKLQHHLASPTDNNDNFFLSFDYFDSDEDQSVVSNLNKRGSIDLKNCTELCSALKFGQYLHVFSIKTKYRNQQRIYYLAADSHEEMDRWFSILCHVLELGKADPPIPPRTTEDVYFQKQQLKQQHLKQEQQHQQQLQQPQRHQQKLSKDYFQMRRRNSFHCSRNNNNSSSNNNANNNFSSTMDSKVKHKNKSTDMLFVDQHVPDTSPNQQFDEYIRLDDCFSGSSYISSLKNSNKFNNKSSNKMEAWNSANFDKQTKKLSKVSNLSTNAAGYSMQSNKTNNKQKPYKTSQMSQSSYDCSKTGLLLANTSTSSTVTTTTPATKSSTTAAAPSLRSSFNKNCKSFTNLNTHQFDINSFHSSSNNNIRKHISTSKLMSTTCTKPSTTSTFSKKSSTRTVFLNNSFAPSRFFLKDPSTFELTNYNSNNTNNNNSSNNNVGDKVDVANKNKIKSCSVGVGGNKSNFSPGDPRNNNIMISSQWFAVLMECLIG